MDYKKIVEGWFENHVAEFSKLNDRVSTLDWRKPGTICYYTRYVFDGCKLYVSGDLGEAVFCLTEKADIDSIATYDINYFHGKLSAFCEDKYSFDSDIATARLKEEIEYANENKDINDDGNEEDTDRNEEINNYTDILNELIVESKSCFNKNGWDYEVNQRYDYLTDYACDIDEWIFKAGDVIPKRVQGYLIGLKMAAKQLKINKS